MDLKERLLAKVAKNSESGCWEWTGFKNPRSGYGDIGVDGLKQRAHRVSYKVFCGQIPSCACVLHRCDNPGCINPDHLFLGTQAENMADKLAKGRQPRGEAAGSSKLTEAETKIILASSASSKVIARKFGVSWSQVKRIRAGSSWAHLQRNGENL